MKRVLLIHHCRSGRCDFHHRGGCCPANHHGLVMVVMEIAAVGWQLGSWVAATPGAGAGGSECNGGSSVVVVEVAV